MPLLDCLLNFTPGGILYKSRDVDVEPYIRELTFGDLKKVFCLQGGIP